MELIKNYALEFKKLGLAGSYTSSIVNNPVDRNQAKATLLKKAFIDVENLGTLLNISPRVVLRVPSTEFSTPTYNYKTFRSWKFPTQEEEYSIASYELKYKYRANAFNLFHFGEYFAKAESNNFFKSNQELIKSFRTHESMIWANPEPAYPYGKTPLNVRLNSSNYPLSSFKISGVNRQLHGGLNNLPFVRLSTLDANTNNLSIQFVSQTAQENDVDLTPYSDRSATGFATLLLDNNLIPNFDKYFNSGTSGANVKSIRNATTRSLKLNSFKEWTSGLTNDLDVSNILPSQTPGFGVGVGESGYNNYYVPFPNSVELYTPTPLNCDTKISFIDNNGDLKINGLLVISIGDPLNGTSEVRYVSPHQIKPIIANTVIDFYNPYVFTKHVSGAAINETGFRKQSKIVQVHTFEVTSEYKNFYLTGDYPELEPDYLAVGKQGLDSRPDSYTYYDSEVFEWRDVRRMHLYDNVSHLRQIVPLKDTPYYKFYNNLYSGSKTLATGTWDGIIPSGKFVNVELLTTVFDKNIGLNLDLALIYKNYGSSDEIDQRIIKAYDPVHFKDLLGRTKRVGDGTISYIGYSTASDNSSAVERAKRNSTKKVNSLIRKLIRINAPELIRTNRKYRKLQAWNARNEALKTNPNPLFKIPSQFIQSIQKY